MTAFADTTQVEMQALEDRAKSAERDVIAAIALIDAQKEELDSLRMDLHAQQLLAASFKDYGIHLVVDWENRRFVVSREYRREHGVFDDWNEAVNAARQLKATLAGELAADRHEPNQRAARARSD